MTVKERINELLDAARKTDTSSSERTDLVEHPRRLCREHKSGMAAFDWPLLDEPGGPLDAPEDSQPADDGTASGPCSIGEMVEQLLMDPRLNYEIAGRVRERFPHARTTNRSVASVAKAMRAKGVDVAPRRAPIAKVIKE